MEDESETELARYERARAEREEQLLRIGGMVFSYRTWDGTEECRCKGRGNDLDDNAAIWWIEKAMAQGGMLMIQTYFSDPLHYTPRWAFRRDISVADAALLAAVMTDAEHRCNGDCRIDWKAYMDKKPVFRAPLCMTSRTIECIRRRQARESRI